MRVLKMACVGLALLVPAGCGHFRSGSAPSEEDVLNVPARLPSGMPVPVLDWETIATSADRAHQTMAILTGNNTAVQSAATGVYPEGSQLALLTWLAREDPHWFGGRIPGSFIALETVTVTRGGDGKIAATYRRYAGNPLREVADTAHADSRKAAILGTQASVMP